MNEGNVEMTIERGENRMIDTEIIRDQNDRFRRGEDSTIPGMIVCTRGVNDLPDEAKSILMQKVKEFDEFNVNNDPHGEHDFGTIAFLRKNYFWKIDYYDEDYRFGTDDPTDLVKTRRVLTIMESSEY